MASSSSPVFFFLLSLSYAAIFTFASHDVVIIDGLKNATVYYLPSAAGPESFTFDCKGEGPYTGVSDGRIFKYEGDQKGWVEFAVTTPNRNRELCDGSTDPNKEPICGRPLGLKFDNKTCNLYIADAYFGLLMVGQSGGVAETLANSTSSDDPPFKFVNGLDVDDQTGVVYFTESSRVFERRLFQLIVLTGDRTGRLLKYDPNTKKVEVLLEHLPFANGVSVNKDGSFLLLSETSSRNIIKFWLKGPTKHTSELLTRVERQPDNIKRNENGAFWVALISNRLLSVNATKTRLGDDPVGVKLDEKGKALAILDGRGSSLYESVSEVMEENNVKLLVGSVSKPYGVLVYK